MQNNKLSIVCKLTAETTIKPDAVQIYLLLELCQFFLWGQLLMISSVDPSGVLLL